MVKTEFEKIIKWLHERGSIDDYAKTQLNNFSVFLSNSEPQIEARSVSENEDEKEYYERMAEAHYCTACGALEEFDCCCDDDS